MNYFFFPQKSNARYRIYVSWANCDKSDRLTIDRCERYTEHRFRAWIYTPWFGVCFEFGRTRNRLGEEL